MIKQQNLENVATPDLFDLRSQIDQELITRVTSDIGHTVTNLTNVISNGRVNAVISKVTKPGIKKNTTAKYQNPSNPTETWNGRGRRPQWITKGGSIEQYRIK